MQASSLKPGGQVQILLLSGVALRPKSARGSESPGDSRALQFLCVMFLSSLFCLALFPIVWGAELQRPTLRSCEVVSLTVRTSLVAKQKPVPSSTESLAQPLAKSRSEVLFAREGAGEGSRPQSIPQWSLGPVYSHLCADTLS